LLLSYSIKYIQFCQVNFSLLLFNYFKIDLLILFIYVTIY